MPPVIPRAPASALSTATSVVVEEVEQTSLAERHTASDEVTVRFAKWHAHGNTAYQKHQFAGFPLTVAQRLVAAGVALVAETPRQRRDAADRFMMTK